MGDASEWAWSGAVPDGNVTLDEDEYVQAWRRYTDMAERFFPEWVVYAFDPDIAMRTREGYGTWRIGTRELDRIDALARTPDSETPEAPEEG